jgi:hypothetical protein
VLRAVLYSVPMIYDVLAPVRAVLRSGGQDDGPGAPALDWHRHKGARALVEGLRAGGSVALALDAAQVSRSNAYRWRRADAEFAAAWDAARDWHTEHVLVAEAVRRATVGDEIVTVTRDGARRTERRKSDLLLMFLIKQRDPSYRDAYKVEVSGDAVPLLVGPRVVTLGPPLPGAERAALPAPAALGPATAEAPPPEEQAHRARPRRGGG